MTLLKQNNQDLQIPVRTAYRRLPIDIWGLGFVSMFMDISSELVHSLLPIFMATVLGTPMMTIGIIEGLAEGTAAISKIFSGAISDYCGKRKLIAIAGYTLSAVTKPIFPMAKTIGWVFGARFVDRLGKGIRGAPRDAMIADIAPLQLRGAAYGLRQSLDSVGALIGPLMAVVLMIWFANDIRAVLWIAVVPALIAVFLLIFTVREPNSLNHAADFRNNLKLNDIKRLPIQYWLIVALGAVFTLSRFSEAFLILRAQDVGLAIGYVPMIMIVMNVFYAIFAYPAGKAADRLSGRTLLLFGLLILVVADIVLAAAVSPWITFFGAAFWGLHMAFTQGLLSKLVADTAPADLRGVAFGVFNFVSGLALFLASVIAGSLWSAFGASATFIAGALFAVIAATGLLLYHPKT
ncbi:MFS transporter [Desulfobacter curvatus]|uniref:MFS transporter n=1 Tax=Desulfobacter curvatus TaxID=2290 RepID=UPI00036B1D17|nr:MFS transporter [Desulfobacter curvatus]